MPIVEAELWHTTRQVDAPVIAFDPGKRRLGVAMTEGVTGAIMPLPAIKRTKWQADLKQIATILRDYQVTDIVVGLPLDVDGGEGTRAQSTRQFAKNLLVLEGVACLGTLLNIMMVDEHLTSHIAEETIRDDFGLSPKRLRDKGAIDSLAACEILRGIL